MKCNELVSAYFDSLRGGVSCEPMQNGWLSVVLPFMYPDHDNVEVYVKDKGDSVVVSDRGETLRRLDTIGMGVQSSGTIAYQVERIAKGFQVNEVDGALLKEGERDQIGDLMFDVVSACTAIGDLALGSRAYQPLTFFDEVGRLLAANDLEFETGRKVPGRFGSEYPIDYIVKTHHRVSYVHTLGARTTSGTRSWVNATFRMWSDIETGEQKVVKPVSLLNEEAAKVKDEDIRLLNSVSTVFLWNQQREFLQFLHNGTKV